MKKFLLLSLFISSFSFSQNKKEAEQKVGEGIALHDAGKFTDAISKYDEALTLDENNQFALTEKAMTLEALKKYDESIELSKLILKFYPNDENETVYITYGNSLDHSGKTDLALKIYDEGLKKYPNYYQLYFNKGIALLNLKKTDEAVQAFQNSTKLNPNHAGSFNALAVLSQSNRVASILASSRYLTIDNQSSRAKGNLEAMIALMGKGVSKQGDNSISLSFDEEMLDKANKKKVTENNFSTVDLVLSMSAALDFDDKNKNKTDVEKYIGKFETLFQTMKEVQKKQRGYYWEFLAPYFIEMKEKNLVEPFVNSIFLAVKNKDAMDYQKNQASKLEAFNNWSKNYQWKLSK